jgi:replicative DNA helicase
VLEEWAGGKDLASAEGSAWLVERVHAYRPDLVVMGPLTNLADRDLRDDEPVRRIRNAVDAARTICNSAFIMEHHAPLKGSMDRERPLRPYGSSLFLKWPDYGYGIKPTSDEKVFEWFKNRGPRVRSREWPVALREGRPNTLEFPWMPSLMPEDTPS